MDPVLNPFSPGAGAPPPELAGRGEVRELIRIAVERIRLGRPNKSILMVGLRGVGKTVLLDRMRDDAEAAGVHTVWVEAPESRSLPAILGNDQVRIVKPFRVGLSRAARVVPARQCRRTGPPASIL